MRSIKKRRPFKQSGPVWLFDLDNTLNDSSTHILPRVNRAMTEFVAKTLNVDLDEASSIRTKYWRQYGATLTGMVLNHGVDPHQFLRDTHQFPDMAQIVKPKPQLANLLRSLRGTKIILTNAPREYALSVLRSAGLHRIMDAIICIEDMQFAGKWQPKPSDAMLRRLLAKLKISAGRALLIEDTLENLHSARHCGVTTIWARAMSMQALKTPQRAGRGRKVSVQVQSVNALKRLAFLPSLTLGLSLK